MLDSICIETRYAKSGELNIAYLARLERMAMSPGTARKPFMLLTQTDVRHVLPVIGVPTMILHRKADKSVRVEHARFLAERISGAKFVELPGDDHLPWVGDVDALLGEAREFLTGERAAPEPDRVLTTILLLVTSTVKDLVVGSGIRFEDLGPRTLEGVPEEWRLFRLAS